MTNLQGASTHALYGFIRSLQKLIKDFSPEYLVAVFDGPDNSESRTQFMRSTKAIERNPPRPRPSNRSSFRFLRSFRIPTLQIPESKLMTLSEVSQMATSASYTTYICSSDKDLCQWSMKIRLFLHLKDNLILDADKVEEVFGVKPSQIVDLLAIMGDTSDNIPGIPALAQKQHPNFCKNSAL